MRLAPGVRLGPYEIESILGAGGMGLVYRARDTRLDRAVALKTLPQEFRERIDRRQRFQSEARLISALSHPHICALFDVGEQDGASFLVMEYLEGETLEDRITRGPLPAGDVLRYAAQIAGALDHAHQARITHRDLKPSNVMLTATGVKLLDFGLARGPVLEAAGASTQSLTSPGRLTSEGTLLGTFQYMAPEQLEGKEADRRTDIFAFGTVLFEMATGRKAFEGASQASLMASILTTSPPVLSSTRSGSHAEALPLALDHIVERCLAKNPDQRWQTARDLKLELEWVATGGPRTTTARQPTSRRYIRPLLLVAATAAMVAAGAFAVSSRFRQPLPDVIRFTLAPPPGAVIPRGVTGTRLAISPDGKQIAFVATSGGVDRLWVQSLDSLTPRPLADGAESPFWSPDSRFVGFFAPGEGQLKKVDIAGGPARVIAPAAVSTPSVWHRNGTILFAQDDTGIFRVSADGGMPIQLTRLDATKREINHLWPAWLPDGRHFLYTATSLDAKGGRAPRTVYVRSVDSGDETLVTHVESRIEYAAPGFLLYVEEGALMSRPFDARSRTLVGEPVKVADDLMYSRTNGNAAFSVSETGVLTYYSSVTPSNLTSFDRAGRAEPSWANQRFSSAIRISPDGQRVMADVQDPRTGSSDIWIYDLVRGVPLRFTTDVGNDTSPAWSPDGLQVVFSSDRGGAPDLFLKKTDGINNEQVLLARRSPQQSNDWSSDGTFIVFEENNRETGLDLWRLPLQGDRALTPISVTRFQEWGARVSPDAAWVAFVSNESGTSDVYVAPLRGSGAKVRVSIGGGIAPRWRRSDGRELFYVVPETNSIMAVAVTTTPTFKAGAPVLLFATRGLPASRRQSREVPYDVSPDGQHFLINTPPEQPPPSGISVVVNWTTGLPR